MITIYLYPGEPNPNDIRLRDPNVLSGGVTIVEADGHAEGEAFVFGDSDVPQVITAGGGGPSLPGRPGRRRIRREREEVTELPLVMQEQDDLEVVMVLAHFLGRTY